MTQARSLAIACCTFLLFTLASGQETKPQSEVFQFSGEQMIPLDSLTSDSTTSELVVPNVFTPNGDGILDYIEVSTDGTTVYTFSIFSRTGAQVFRSFSPRIFWDGTNNEGLELTEGVYYYVIEEEGDAAPYSSAGFFYLYR